MSESVTYRDATHLKCEYSEYVLRETKGTEGANCQLADGRTDTWVDGQTKQSVEVASRKTSKFDERSIVIFEET